MMSSWVTTMDPGVLDYELGQKLGYGTKDQPPSSELNLPPHLIRRNAGRCNSHHPECAVQRVRVTRGRSAPPRYHYISSATMMDHLLQLLEGSGSGSTDNAKALGPDLSTLVDQVRQGDFVPILTSQATKQLLGLDQTDRDHAENGGDSGALLFRRLDELLASALEASQNATRVFLLGYAALHAFLQSNVTGPPLRLPPNYSLSSSTDSVSVDDGTSSKENPTRALAVDGVAAYPLIPHAELFHLAKVVFNHPRLTIHGTRRMRVRVNFLHQRLLVENVPRLQARIYEDLEDAEWSARGAADQVGGLKEDAENEKRVRALLERAGIHSWFGLDGRAREDINEAARMSGFEFALTGRLGKRTRYQTQDISQLVVLARSAPEGGTTRDQAPSTDATDGEGASRPTAHKPGSLDLNDDTLLESISFSAPAQPPSTVVQTEDTLSPNLLSLDPSNQPLLKPLDSITLLSLAASITNTSPAHGLTREETLPYATRVLDGGSSNWQIYTQALLVRSRIEGYKSRTQERGLLQLQALVDQIIVETGASTAERESQPTSFLPKAKESEEAPVAERLRYIHQLRSPTRWELEAELAARWVSLGGLKSAIEIYERLRMWAEVALCWAAMNEEKKARELVRRQLFKTTDDSLEGTEMPFGEELDPLPPDAPRYFCILGDIDQDPAMYSRAWTVSNERYARAQRSLGKYHFAKKDYARAADGYARSLRLDPQNQGSWFALGSARLQVKQWDEATEAFTRAVQLDEQDAESWSNLGAALMERRENSVRRSEAAASNTDVDGDEPVNGEFNWIPDAHRYRQDALKAFKKAAALKYDSWRIWENVLIVATSTHPPSYAEMVSAMRRLIEIRGPSAGEKCIDADILDLLVRHITTDGTSYDPSKPGLQRTVIDLIDHHVTPLITSSRRLWQIVARLQLWRRRPGSALEASEKAWRTVTAAWSAETGTEAQWDEVVDATIELADAYESLGPMERTEGLGAGEGQVVARNWKFKAGSAIRGVLGRGREAWEGSAGWERLRERMEGLKSDS